MSHRNETRLTVNSYPVLSEIVYIIEKALKGHDHKPVVAISAISDVAAKACIKAQITANAVSPSKKVEDTGAGVVRAYLEYVAGANQRLKDKGARIPKALAFRHPEYAELHREILGTDVPDWSALERGKNSYIQFAIAQAQRGWERTHAAAIAVGFLTVLLARHVDANAHEETLGAAFSELIRRMHQYNLDHLRFVLLAGDIVQMEELRKTIFSESFGETMDVSTYLTGDRFSHESYKASDENAFRKELRAAAGAA